MSDNVAGERNRLRFGRFFCDPDVLEGLFRAETDGGILLQPCWGGGRGRVVEVVTDEIYKCKSITFIDQERIVPSRGGGLTQETTGRRKKKGGANHGNECDAFLALNRSTSTRYYCPSRRCYYVDGFVTKLRPGALLQVERGAAGRRCG